MIAVLLGCGSCANSFGEFGLPRKGTLFDMSAGGSLTLGPGLGTGQFGRDSISVSTPISEIGANTNRFLTVIHFGNKRLMPDETRISQEHEGISARLEPG